MRYAVIDIGTNSVRCMLADNADGNITVLARARENTRLGKGLYTEQKLLSRDSMQATVSAIASFMDSIASVGYNKVICIATSAVRDSSNGDELAQMIKDATGIDLRVLSGKEEAIAGFVGAMSHRDGVLVDIGGGSTEVIQMTDEEHVVGISYDCGCVRLSEMFGHDYNKADDFIRSEVESPSGKPITFIGGTASALAMIYKGLAEYDEDALHGTFIPVEYIFSLRDKLLTMTQSEIDRLCFFDPKRGEILPFGLMIISHIVAMAKADGLTVSCHGIMHGLIRLDT